MESEDLANLIFSEIKPKLENNQGLSLLRKKELNLKVG